MDMEKRLSLSVVERAQKHTSTAEEEGRPAKAKKVSPPSVRDRLLQCKHLLYWWNREPIKPVLRQICEMELENMGVHWAYI